MKGKYVEEYWTLKKDGHQSFKSDGMSFGRLETKHSLITNSLLTSKLNKATTQ